MKVYLAGPINGCDDSQAHGWRDAVRADPLAKLAEIIDPMTRDYRGAEAANVEAIVAGDLTDIDSCDVLLANCWTPSYGTAMEIFYAHQKGKVVVIVSESRSPWLVHHCDFITDSLESACQFVHMWGMVA